MASLYQTFEQMNDPRSPLGRRHPLPAMLTHAAVAILAGARSCVAIAQFGRDRGSAFGSMVGYTRDETPCFATFSNVFRALPAQYFERGLRRWLDQREQAGWQRASLDGKSLRGAHGHELPGVRLLAMFDHEAKAAIAQMPVNARTNEHKKALEMLEVIDLQDKTITGDAAFCQHETSEKVVKKGVITSGRSKTTSPNSSRRSSKS